VFSTARAGQAVSGSCLRDAALLNDHGKVATPSVRLPALASAQVLTQQWLCGSAAIELQACSTGTTSSRSERSRRA